MQDKQFLLLLVPTRECPLSTRAIWTYSHLVYRSRLGRGATQQDVAEITRHHHTTVSKIVKHLCGHGLVEARDDLYFALDDAKSYFHRKKNGRIKDWQDRFATVTVYLLNPEQTTLTFTENLVLWLIHSYNRKGKKIRRLGIATQLKISEKTVRRSLEALRAKGLIDEAWNLTLDDDKKKLWADLPAKEEEKIAGKSDFMLATRIIGHFPRDYKPQFDNFAATRDNLKAMLGVMRQADYTSHQVEQFFLTELPDICGINHDNGMLPYLCLDAFLNRCLGQAFRLAEQVTEANRRRRRFAGRNSLGIFREITVGAMRFAKAWLLDYGAEGIQNMAPNFDRIAAQWLAKK